MEKKIWTMNETQKDFMKALADYVEGATLLDLKLAGKEFKTGSINTLISKGFVEIVGDKSYEMDIVFNGNKVGKVTKTYKLYKVISK